MKRCKLAIVPLLLAIALPKTSTFVTASELEAHSRDSLLDARREKLRQKWEQRFRAADSNNNRLLSLQEATAAKLPKRLLKNFSGIDLNRDAQLSPDELWAAYEKRLKAQARRARPKKYR